MTMKTKTSEDNQQTIYKRQDSANGFQVVFSADFNLIERISKESSLFLKRFAITEMALRDIELGIREALSNAIRHGSRNMSQALIRYQLSCSKKLLVTIIVCDPGSGFDWSAIIHSETPILAESGRGLPILLNCFDTIHFNDFGNEVTLIKMIGQEEINHEQN